MDLKNIAKKLKTGGKDKKPKHIVSITKQNKALLLKKYETIESFEETVEELYEIMFNSKKSKN